jgi:hypothetical protein
VCGDEAERVLDGAGGRLLHFSVLGVSTGHEAVVDVEEGHALGGGVVRLVGFEPGATGVVLFGIALCVS